MSKFIYSARLFKISAFLILLASTNVWAQTTYYTRVASGNWTSVSTWSTVGCSGVAASTTPGVNDHVVICTGHTVTFNAAAHTTIANLTIQTSGVLTISVGRNLFVNSLVLDGLVNGGGAGDIRVGNIAGSTISGTGSFNTTTNNGQLRLLRALTILAGTDLKFNSNGRFHLNGMVATNNGKITIGSSSTFGGGGTFVNNSSTSHLVFSRSANWPNGTTLTATATGNTVEFAAASGTRLMDSQGSYYHLIISGGGTKVLRATSTTIRGNLTISNGATFDTNTGTRTINIAGNWINNLGGVFDENTSLVTFNGSANDQTLAPPSGVTGELFYDLTINNTFAGGKVTASGNVSITSTRTLTMTAGIFDMQANTLGQSGAANFTATGGDLRLAKISTTLPELTGTYSVTGGTITFNGASDQTIKSLNTAPSNYHHIVLGGAGIKTLGGNITVRGNWSNSGTSLAGNFIVSFAGTGTQTITNASGENFYSITVNTTGPLTLAPGSNATVTNTLTMTSGNINLNGQTLTVGSGGASTLARASGICYGGTFRRYFPATAISSTAGSFYGLFPVGSSISYRPVQINSTVSPTNAGFVSVIHTDATTATDVSYNDNESTPIQRVTDMRSAISTATLAGGAYTLSVSFTTLSSAGLLTNLKLETQAGPPYGVGTSDPSTGSVSSPTGIRRLLSETNLNNIFVMGTTNKSTTPLVSSFYSRRTGNWDDVTAGNSTWSLTDGGASCNCIPTVSSIVYINPTHVVTVNTPATTDFVNVRTGATLNGTANLTVNYDIRTQASGIIAPTGGSWSIGRSLFIAGASTSTSAASLTITSNLQIDAGNSLTLSANSSVAENLIIDGTLNIGATTMTLSGNGASISGNNGTINGSGTITMSNSKTIASGSTLTFQPVLNLLAGTTITNLGSVTTSGNITGVNAATSVWTNTSGSSLTTSATSLLTTGVLNAIASPNTVTYNGSGAQAVKTPAASYYNLVIANANTKSTSGNFSVINLLTIQDAAILNCGTNQLNGAGGLTMTGTSEFIIARAANATYPEMTGVYTLTGGTITFSPASNTYSLRAVDYNNLTLGGNGGSYDFGNGPFTINNAFTYSPTTSNNTNRDLTVGTFTMTSGTLTTSGANTIIEINGAGGWTRNGGTFTPNANTTVLFSGSADQQIGGSVATTFTNFEISNSGPVGLTLNQDITISGTFAFTGGNLVTSATHILTMSSGATVSGITPPSDDSFVEGPMEKVGNANFTFPVGKDGSYRPIDVSSLSASGTFRAEYFHADPNSSGYNTTSKDGTLTRVNSGEYWILDRPSGSQTALVTLSWDAYSGTVDEISSLRVARWDGTTWRDHGNNFALATGSISPGTGSIISNAAVTSFSPFTLAASNLNNALPIELLYFKGELVEEQVLLTWKTASEINNDYFTVQKSRDGLSFEDVGNVMGSGTTNQAHAYSLLDTTPYSNISYYRLKQTDFDGTSTYSKLIAIDSRGSTEQQLVVEAFPNPSRGNDIVTISYQGLPDEMANFSLMDSKGNILLQSQSPVTGDGKFTFVMHTCEYAKGVYIFNVLTSQGRKLAKVVIN